MGNRDYKELMRRVNEPSTKMKEQKLPIAEDILEEHNLINVYGEVRCAKSDVIKVIESHTQAYIVGLWEEIRQLQSDVAHNADKALGIAMERDALRERVKELETTLSINRYTIEDMRKSFYAGHSLCDDEWRDKTKLTGFDEFIDSLK